MGFYYICLPICLLPASHDLNMRITGARTLFLLEGAYILGTSTSAWHITGAHKKVTE